MGVAVLNFFSPTDLDFPPAQQWTRSFSSPWRLCADYRAPHRQIRQKTWLLLYCLFFLAGTVKSVRTSLSTCPLPNLDYWKSDRVEWQRSGIDVVLGDIHCRADDTRLCSDQRVLGCNLH